MGKPYVYIAGPYTKPDKQKNTESALQAANCVLGIGGIPYVPHLTHYWEQYTSKPYRAWLALDFAWLAKCDVLLRLVGDSGGADMEEAFALGAGLHVFNMRGEEISEDSVEDARARSNLLYSLDNFIDDWSPQDA